MDFAFLAACSGQPTETTKTATSKPAPTAEEASIVNSSYIMGIARDTQELETLGAKTGWPEFFKVVIYRPWMHLNCGHTSLMRSLARRGRLWRLLRVLFER